MLKRMSVYLSFVRFSHSVFALPFALAGALLAARHTPITWPVIGLVACLVYRRTNSTLAMSGATLLLIAVAFWSELTLNGRCH